MIPPFKNSRLLQVVDALATKWGPDQLDELEANLRAVTNHQDYLRSVADLGPQAADTLVSSAVLGISIARVISPMIQAQAGESMMPMQKGARDDRP